MNSLIKCLNLIFRLILCVFLGCVITLIGVNAIFFYKNFYMFLINICIILICIILAINIIWTKNNYKKRFLIIGILLFVFTVALLFYNNHEKIKSEELTLDSSIMSIKIDEYMPFDKESQIVKIKDSSLKLKENLPVVDGAAALFPVYSAFVNAVYSQEALEKTVEKATENPQNVTIIQKGEYYIEGHNEKFSLKNGAFQYNNTVEGYRKLAQKETDIFFGAYPSEEQIEYAKENNTTFKFIPIGREGFVFFVNKENPVDNLTTDEIRKIYSGEITNWKKVGGKNRKILAFQRNEGSGSQSMLIRFMEGKKIKEPIKKEKVDSMSIIVNDVADYKNYNNSIGFSFRYYAEDIMKNQDVKLLSIDGIAPTVENITSEAYPITTDFYAVTYEENTNPNIDKFIEWILSEQGQKIIEITGYARIGK